MLDAQHLKHLATRVVTELTGWLAKIFRWVKPASVQNFKQAGYIATCDTCGCLIWAQGLSPIFRAWAFCFTCFVWSISISFTILPQHSCIICHYFCKFFPVFYLLFHFHSWVLVILKRIIILVIFPSWSWMTTENGESAILNSTGARFWSG